LRKAGFPGKVLGVSSVSTISKAIELGVIDAGASARDASHSADLIYLAQPIHRIIEILPELNQWVKPEALVTDAGSTKSVIMDAARSLSRCQFLGGHPLAGKESRGVESADADLFQKRIYVITPRQAGDLETPVAQEFLRWISQIGSKTVVMDAPTHDRALAFTSHLPQIASTGLACTVAKQGDAAAQLFGPGLLDSTRLALSAYEVWADILATNRSEIDLAIGSYIEVLQRLRASLASDETGQFFEKGGGFAARLRTTS
jgi:prephenate dehydrogenase